MRGAVFVYSMTGNTALASARLAEAMSIPFEIIDMTRGPMDASGFDVVGFACSTDFWGVPRVVAETIAAMPIHADTPAFCMNTYGGVSGNTLRELVGLVASRGFRVIASHSLHVPDSYPPLLQRGITASHAPGARALSRFEAFTARLSALVARAEEGERLESARVSVGPVNRLVPRWSRTAGIRAMGARQVDAGACTACGACAKGCPVGAISLAPLPVFDDAACVGCWRCYNRCPSRAVITTRFKGTAYYPGPSSALREKLGRARCNGAADAASD